ncbi:MAG TPA: hypothetical protein VK470_18280, partial [Bacteroidota bacterium]|nr:hypothetical protein [Bacteroidota bacterium]
FSSPIVVRLEYNGVPITGAALVYESTDNAPLFETATDGKGEAAYSGCIRSLTGNTIRVKPALGELAKEFEKSALSSAALFTFTPQPSAIGIEIAVTGVQGAAADNMRSTLASAVGKIGYRIVPSSRYKLETVLHPKPASKIESLSGTLYTVQVEAVSTLTDKQSNAALGSVSSVASGGGRSESDAIAKASGSIAPDRMKLAELIEKINQ